MSDSSPRPSGERAPKGVDSTVAHTARVWNYWLGGKDNFAVDRVAGDEVSEIFPDMLTIARASRAFLTRSIRYLAAEAGIRQFLDVGTGLPTVDNTHEVAQRVAPESLIVYVDNDPLVLVHARALLTSTPEGATAYVDADLHDPGTFLDEAAKTLDFGKPIALILSGILGHVTDDGEAQSIVSRLVDALPSASYLSLNDGTNVVAREVFDDAAQRWNETVSAPYRLRSPEQIAGFFDGLELVEPGVVSCPLWRPDPGASEPVTELDAFGGVGRKP